MARDIGCPTILFVNRHEPRSVSLSTINSIEGIAFRLQNGLLRLTTGPRDDLVVTRLGFVDHPVALLLCLVDLVPRRLDRIRRVDVLKNDQVDCDTGFVLVAERLQSLLDRHFDILPPDCEHLGDGAVADHFAHHSLVHITERFVVGTWANAAHFEQVLIGIRDAILHDPVDHRDVQVTG